MHDHQLQLSPGLNLEKQSGRLPSAVFYKKTIPRIFRRENKSLPTFSRVSQECPLSNPGWTSES